MEEYMCGDIWTWLHDIEPRVFRYWVYRRMFTPKEQDAKFIDEGFYEDSYCKFGIIRECIQLPDNDILIGFQDAELYDSGTVLSDSISYFRLTEIRMAYCKCDQTIVKEEEEG